VEPFLQQVDFFRDEFKKQRIFFSALQMLSVAGVFFSILSVLSIVQVSMMNSLEERATIALQQKQRMSEQLEKMQANFIEPKEDPNLRNILTLLNENIKHKQVLVGFLGEQSKKKSFSFSSVMHSLAENTLDGVWLTTLEIITEGSNYRLVGNTRHPDLIPRYIEQLKKSVVLTGTYFSLFDLERVKNDQGYLKFILSSEGGGVEPEITSR